MSNSRISTSFDVGKGVSKDAIRRNQEEARDLPADASPETLSVVAQPKIKDTVACRPIVPSISLSTTFELSQPEKYLEYIGGGYIYARMANHSTETAAHVINQLEGGEGALVFSSGISSITTTLLAILKQGDHIIAPDPVYVGTYTFIKNILPNYGIEVTFVEACNVEAYRAAIKPNTKVFYGETPTNPTLGLLDLDAFAAVAKSVPNSISMVDSTFASPYIQQTLRHGVDIVVHSTTKYIGGHSDHTGGVMCTSDKNLFFYLAQFQSQFGSIQSPFEAFLMTRGLRTLPIRMEKHSKNAMRLAELLESHPQISRCYYPGLKSHPHFEIAQRQMKLPGGMVVFEMKKGYDAALQLMKNLKLAVAAVSLGGTETLLEHPASMTHGPFLMTVEEREKGGITPGLMRLSVGLENGDDLVADFKQALSKVQ